MMSAPARPVETGVEDAGSVYTQALALGQPADGGAPDRVCGRRDRVRALLAAQPLPRRRESLSHSRQPATNGAAGDCDATGAHCLAECQRDAIEGPPPCGPYGGVAGCPRKAARGACCAAGSSCSRRRSSLWRSWGWPLVERIRQATLTRGRRPCAPSVRSQRRLAPPLALPGRRRTLISFRASTIPCRCRSARPIL